MTAAARPAPPHAIARSGDAITAVLMIAPRTKKNSQHIRRGIGGRPFIAQGPVATQFAQDVKAAVLPEARRLRLPLPDRAYRLDATFYVDGRGKAADVVGLVQALQDALEGARVLSDDWWVRVLGECRVVADAPPWRVVFALTPTEEDADG